MCYFEATKEPEIQGKTHSLHNSVRTARCSKYPSLMQQEREDVDKNMHVRRNQLKSEYTAKGGLRASLLLAQQEPLEPRTEESLLIRGLHSMNFRTELTGKIDTQETKPPEKNLPWWCRHQEEYQTLPTVRYEIPPLTQTFLSEALGGRGGGLEANPVTSKTRVKTHHD